MAEAIEDVCELVGVTEKPQQGVCMVIVVDGIGVATGAMVDIGEAVQRVRFPVEVVVASTLSTGLRSGA
jgi:endonuclease V-like protein UPF0215 family